MFVLLGLWAAIVGAGVWAAVMLRLDAIEKKLDSTRKRDAKKEISPMAHHTESCAPWP